jgi:hypothetical protein
VEHRRGVTGLGVLEKGGVDRTGRVVEGDEHDPTAGANRWGLGRDFHTGDEDLRAVAHPHQVTGTRDADRGEELLVRRQDVPARVQPEHLELGPHLLGAGQLRQPADGRLVRRITQVECHLHVDRPHLGRRLRLSRRSSPHIETCQGLRRQLSA